MPINNSIINQKGTPAFFSDIFANRPTYGYAGRVFISTDTGAIYEDTGTSWTLIADAGAGTTGTLQQVTTNGNTTTLGISVNGINFNAGAGTGTLNTAIGSSALSSNTTGAANVGVGYQSMIANTTGGANVAIGRSTLSANTTGSNNTSLGSQALKENTTAGFNTGIGTASIQTNTTGANNTAVGYGTLTQNTTASFNTAIGGNSLTANTTGASNTAIGYNSGSLITTGSNNTILGNYVGTSTLASNIVLSDGAGNVRLFSDANGLIGINQAVGSTIGGQLDIHSTQTYALVLNGLSTSNAYTAFSNASVGKWRIGNTYNAGANSFDIFNLGTSSTALSFNSTTNNATFIANVTASSLIKSGGTSAQILAADGSVITAGTNITISGGTISSSGGGSITLSAIGSTPNANAATLTGSALNLQPASTSFGGVVTTGVQNFTGVKSFASNTLIGSTTDDATNKLQVTGSCKFTTQVNINGATNDADIALHVKATAGSPKFIFFGRDSSNNPVYKIDSTGATTIATLAGTGSRAVVADSNGLLSAPVSDISVKTNIKTIGYGLNEILKMNPVWFDYIDEYKNFGQTRQNGNIAQEMETIIPEAVFTTPSTGKMGINYDQLHAVYIKAIQELKAEIDALKNN